MAVVELLDEIAAISVDRAIGRPGDEGTGQGGVRYTWLMLDGIMYVYEQLWRYDSDRWCICYGKARSGCLTSET